MYTVPQLKQAARILAKTFDLSEADARQKITELNKDNPDTVLDILAGKIPDILEKNSRSTKNFPESRPARSKRSTATATDHAERELSQTIAAPLETVQGEIVDSSELPAGITDMIDEWMAEHAQRYNIDIQKASGLQWRALCLYVGQHIKASKILIDREKQKAIGGIPLKAEKVEKLLSVWEVYTSTYKHVPLAADFIAFSGVSEEWFYDTEKRLSSSQVGIAKKMRAIEERALGSAICDSRENPTGRIYYTKARLGWRESVEIVHTSAAAVSGLDDIPKLTDNNN